MARHARAVLGLVSACLCGIAMPANGQTTAASSAGDTAASHASAAERFLEVTNAEKLSHEQTDRMFQSMSESMAKSNPAGAAAMSSLRAVIQKYASYDALKPDLIKAYTATYTEAELNRIIAFYQTDLGRMIIERTPKVLALTQAASAEHARAMQGELRQAMEKTIEDQMPQEEKARINAPGATLFAFQVDTAAALASDSPPLHYPDGLKGSGVPGEVDAMFVVDTLGTADVRTLKIMRSTNSIFARALQDQLSGLRFTPAKRHGAKVKQFVQMPFRFDPAQ